MRSKKLFRSLFAFAFLLLAAPTTDAQIIPAAAGATIGGFIQSLNDVIQQLESSAHSLIDQGNIALAQQQMLLSGILTQLVQQLGTTYGTELDKTFGQLSTAEQNTFGELASSLSSMQNLESKSFGDVQNIIYSTQGAANQIIDRLPLGPKYPIFYGVSIRDLTTQPAQQPADIVLLGFHWYDPALAKNPTITIGSDAIPDNMVSVQQDRIQIEIPDATKAKISFGNSPCSPRMTFPIKVTAYWGEAHGFWPITWTSQRSSTFFANALPGPQLYDFTVSYDGERSTTALQQDNYAQKSGYVAMGCEETTSTNVRFQAPDGAQEINCTASWVDAVAVKNSSQNCAVGGNVVTASGSITGLDRQCYVIGHIFGKHGCNCPGGGHGNLQVAGSYKVPQTKTEEVNNQIVGTYTMAEGSSTFISLPSDSALRIRSINAVARRNKCQSTYDDIEINLPENPLAKVNQNSNNGFFKASFWSGQLSIQN